ncbi:hypothetical protein M3N64_10985 [Sporolactobacillus sp. CPB3-1]|uniref:Uncharacterized protein n=1 Tax=Sporolactobacillus mangiferae TaxID=2940498 RepID=A0ABT0MCZ5_9BACL|nr:hypothetical protein [Sporolactobacillus mangiferae]MCL1632443.1 hypothetical protein [Sporolactobacillus mangiferae]
MKHSTGYIIGSLLFVLSLIMFHYDSFGSAAALSLFIAALFVIVISELSMKMGKK